MATQIRNRKLCLRWLLLGLFYAITPLQAGCYQRTTAPAIEYDAEDAELLREELTEMDWE